MEGLNKYLSTLSEHHDMLVFLPRFTCRGICSQLTINPIGLASALANTWRVHRTGSMVQYHRRRNLFEQTVGYIYFTLAIAYYGRIASVHLWRFHHLILTPSIPFRPVHSPFHAPSSLYSTPRKPVPSIVSLLLHLRDFTDYSPLGDRGQFIGIAVSDLGKQVSYLGGRKQKRKTKPVARLPHI